MYLHTSKDLYSQSIKRAIVQSYSVKKRNHKIEYKIFWKSIPIFVYIPALSQDICPYEKVTKKGGCGIRYNIIIKDGFKGNDSLISWMLAPLGCFLCVKNDNKNRRLDKLSQSFSDIFHNSFTWQNIVKIYL